MPLDALDADRRGGHLDELAPLLLEERDLIRCPLVVGSRMPLAETDRVVLRTFSVIDVVIRSSFLIVPTSYLPGNG
jgi:hypothetical protein